MAIYRYSAQVIGRSGGRSATAAAAYRAGVVIADERTGEVHDYRRRAGVEAAFVVTPEGAPAWVLDRCSLWNRVEATEGRKDSQLAREVLVALPCELAADQRLDLVKRFVREQFVADGMVADVAIHLPGGEGDERNHHAHIMLTMRRIEGEGFGKKAREWNDKARLESWRKAWQEYANRALEAAGSDERIDHRSLAARRADSSAEDRRLIVEPEPKLPHAPARLAYRAERRERMQAMAALLSAEAQIHILDTRPPPRPDLRERIWQARDAREAAQQARSRPPAPPYTWHPPSAHECAQRAQKAAHEALKGVPAWRRWLPAAALPAAAAAAVREAQRWQLRDGNPPAHYAEWAWAETVRERAQAAQRHAQALQAWQTRTEALEARAGALERELGRLQQSHRIATTARPGRPPEAAHVRRNEFNPEIRPRQGMGSAPAPRLG